MKRDSYLHLLSSTKGKKIDLCLELYRVLSTEPSRDDKIKAFQFICEKALIVQSDNSIPLEENYEKEELLELRSDHSDYIDYSIKYLTQKAYRCKYSNDIFYRYLWTEIFEDYVLSTEKEKGFALYWILIDRSIPFVELNDEIAVSSADFTRINKDTRIQQHKISYVLSLDLGKRTEYASLVLQILQQCKSQKEKSFLLAFAFSVLERSGEDEEE